MEPIRELIAVDLEMTGLQVKTDRILEIGAVRLVDGQLRDTFQTFVNPHRRIDARITELTGIRPEMVEDAPEAEEALRKFLEFAGEAPFLGHNVIFDYSFLKQCAVNHKISLERSALDTLKIARKVLKEPEKKSLEALCGYFQIDREHAHRAVDDAKATAELFLMLQQKYQQQEPGLFVPKPLHYKVKKQGPLTPAQKRDLNHLMIYHRIEFNIELDSLTKSEALRMIDKIYAQYGRIPEQEGSDNV